MTRPLPRRTGCIPRLRASEALAVIVGCVAVGLLWVPGASASTSSGSSLWSKSVAAARAAGSLHYVEVSGSKDGTTTIVGDVNRVSGSQVVTVRSSTHPHSTTDNGTADIDLVGHTAYVKGDVGGLGFAIGAPASFVQQHQLAGKWISITPAAPDGLYQTTAAELTLASVIENFDMKGPFTLGSPSRVSGTHVLAVHGFVSGVGKLTVHQTFEVKASGAPVPLASSSPASGTKVGKTANLYSRWGEPVSVTAPTGAIPILSLLSPTTTTAPQVVTAAATSISTAPPRGNEATPTAERV